MGNWSNPVLTTAYDQFLADLKSRDVDAITLSLVNPTNPVVGTIKLSRAPVKFQEWSGSAYVDQVLSVAGGGTGAASAAVARTNLGIGSLATQDAAAVNITGGSIVGVTLNAGALTGALPAVSGVNLTNLNASNLASGTVPDGRLAGNIPRLDASGNWFAGYLRTNYGGTPAVPSFGIYDAFNAVSAGVYGSGRSVHLVESSREIISGFSYRAGDGAGGLGLFFNDWIHYTWTTAPAFDGPINNWAAPSRNAYYRVAASVVGVVVSGISTMSGFGLTGGLEFHWFNAGGTPFTLAHSSVASAVGNRFLCPGAADVSVGAYQTVKFSYSGADGAWVVSKLY